MLNLYAIPVAFYLFIFFGNFGTRVGGGGGAQQMATDLSD
jgi:hypothetical protein